MQTVFLVELGEGADRLEIPWASPDTPANRHYDLKAHPDLLDQIAEAQANPPLRRFLQAVNAPESFFATAKCNTWRTEAFTDAERATFPVHPERSRRAARTKFASYVDLVFAPPPFNFHRQHYEQLAERLAQQLAPEPAAARVELCLRHCYYHPRQSWGFYLTIFLYGYGGQQAEAEREWAAGLAALAQALLRLSAVLQQAIGQSEATGEK